MASGANGCAPRSSEPCAEAVMLREGSVGCSVQENRKKSENLALLSLALFSSLLLQYNNMEVPPTCLNLQGRQGTFHSHSPRARLLSFLDPLKSIHSLLCTRAARCANCSIHW